MNGAREYAGIFNTGQFGKLYFVCGSHARGKTFHVYVLPDGEDAIIRHHGNPPSNKDAVEVYGMLGGQNGWTEYYGWKHHGPWEKDFIELVAVRKAKIESIEKDKQVSIKEKNDVEKERVSGLLKRY